MTRALGLILLGGILTMAIFAPLLAPYDPGDFVGRPLERPSAAHRLGTNDAGQDILSELIYGARISTALGVGAGLGALALALLVGGMAGALGGAPDWLLMRVTDLLLAIPRLPLLILLTALLGASLVTMTASIALLFWAQPARVIRAGVLGLRERGYVRLTAQFGAGPFYALRRHILPALYPLAVFAFVTTAGRAIALEAGLAFFGLGDPTAKSWGLMMRYALNLPGLFLTDRWQWWLVPPGVCITLLVLSLTFIGLSWEEKHAARA